MEHYKVLGVNEKASMEEIKEAYESKVNKFKVDIKDEKRLKEFVKVFDKAYQQILLERASNKPKRVIESEEKNLKQSSKNNIDRGSWDKYDDFKDKHSNEYNKEVRVSKSEKRSTSKNSSMKRQKTNKKKPSKSSNKDTGRQKNKRDVTKKQANLKEESSSFSSLIKVPFKILALPIIAVLSVIIFLCKIVNLISWISAKVIMIAAISVSAIHGYQIYIGQPIQNNIFILSALAFGVSLFLPSILKVLPSLLEGINNKLKKFVF